MTTVLIDRIWSCSHERPTAIDEASRLLGDTSSVSTRVRTAVKLQCIIDMLWSRRFRTRAIRQNNCSQIPRITASRLSSTLLRCDVDSVKLTWDARDYATGLMQVALLDASPTSRNISRLHTVSKEPRTIVRGKDMSLIAGSAYKPMNTAIIFEICSIWIFLDFLKIILISIWSKN